MNEPIPFHITDWSQIEAVEYPGETGVAFWKTILFGNLRVRSVEYSANYLADHWCSKGHIIFCVEGEMATELNTGEQFILKKGMSYQVSDEMSFHRTSTVKGAKLFIVDGGFLASTN
jgi:hypothetical protein